MLTKSDFILMSWEEYQTHIHSLTVDLNAFLKTENIIIDFVVPILRGGGVPAISLAYQLNIFKMYPVQLKHDYKTHSIHILNNSFEILETSSQSPTILLVDGYHATGKSTYIVYDIIKKVFPFSKIIYVTLGRDVGHLTNQRDFLFTCHAFFSNECDVIPKKQSEEEGVLTKYTLFPWEVLEDEIDNMNNELIYGVE